MMSNVRSNSDKPRRQEPRVARQRHRFAWLAAVFVFFAPLVAVVAAHAACVPCSGTCPFDYGQRSRIALVIGNNEHAGSDIVVSTLTNAANDAASMEAVLTQLDFKVACYTNLPMDKFLIVSEAFLNRVQSIGSTKEDGVALFYFAGHGVYGNNRQYLLMSHNDYAHQDICGAPANAQTKIYPVRALLQNLKLKKGKSSAIVVLDACRRNICSSDAGPGTSISFEDFDAEFPYTIYSTGAGGTASDGTPGKPNGVFMESFLEYARDWGRSLSDVIDYVTDALKNVQRVNVSRTSLRSARQSMHNMGVVPLQCTLTYTDVGLRLSLGACTFPSSLRGTKCSNSISDIKSRAAFQLHCQMREPWAEWGQKCLQDGAKIFADYYDTFDRAIKACPAATAVATAPIPGTTGFVSIGLSRLPPGIGQTANAYTQQRPPFVPIPAGGNVIVNVVGDRDAPAFAMQKPVPLMKFPIDAGRARAENVAIDLVSVGTELILDRRAISNEGSIAVRLPFKTDIRGYLKRSQVEPVEPEKEYSISFEGDRIYPDETSFVSLEEAVRYYKELGSRGGGLRITTSYYTSAPEGKLLAHVRASALRSILTGYGVGADRISDEDRIAIEGAEIGKEKGTVPAAVVEVMREPRASKTSANRPIQ